MHKSIFLTIDDYESDPISEFRKINNVLNKQCGHGRTLTNILDQYFLKSTILRCRYINLYDCINSITFNISRNYNCYDLELLDDDIKTIIFNEFYNYCEIIFHLLYISYPHAKQEYLYLNEDVFVQAVEIIKLSLKSLNHQILPMDGDPNLFEVIKINHEAQIVAALSEQTIKKAIVHYLGAKDNDVKEKENRLSQLIILLEPNIKIYKSENSISKVSEYVQLIRHAALKKNEKRYQWFYDNKEKYLDDIFSLCIYAQHYFIAKEVINTFEELKKNA